jgi:tRNA A-37 threonylcarbamoyl transferase component Bud32
MWLFDRLKRRNRLEREGMRLEPLAIPGLNACQEFGKHAARLHAAKLLGGRDITNCMFKPDGTLKAMFSIGRGRVLERPLTVEERANDLAALKKQLGAQGWEAAKIGYRFMSPGDADEVLARVEPPSLGLGTSKAERVARR